MSDLNDSQLYSFYRLSKSNTFFTTIDAQTILDYFTTDLDMYLDCIADGIVRLLNSPTANHKFAIENGKIAITFEAENDIDLITILVDGDGITAERIRMSEPKPEHHFSGGTLVKTELFQDVEHQDDCTSELVAEIGLYEYGLRILAHTILALQKMKEGNNG